MQNAANTKKLLDGCYPVVVTGELLYCYRRKVQKNTEWFLSIEIAEW